jgi:hypothetical protein
MGGVAPQRYNSGMALKEVGAVAEDGGRFTGRHQLLALGDHAQRQRIHFSGSDLFGKASQ